MLVITVIAIALSLIVFRFSIRSKKYSIVLKLLALILVATGAVTFAIWNNQNDEGKKLYDNGIVSLSLDTDYFTIQDTMLTGGELSFSSHDGDSACIVQYYESLQGSEEDLLVEYLNTMAESGSISQIQKSNRTIGDKTIYEVTGTLMLTDGSYDAKVKIISSENAVAIFIAEITSVAVSKDVKTKFDTAFSSITYSENYEKN